MFPGLSVIWSCDVVVFLQKEERKEKKRNKELGDGFTVYRSYNISDNRNLLNILKYTINRQHPKNIL